MENINYLKINFEQILEPLHWYSTPWMQCLLKMFSFPTFGRHLEFWRRTKCLILEWLNSLYVTLYPVHSGDALHQIDLILVASINSKHENNL